MDRRQKLVFEKLKLKTKALGFNTKELKGVAATIADNLTSAEDASDEDVNAEIDERIEAVIPFLSVGQSQASRLINEWKNKRETGDDDEPDDEDDGPSDGRAKRQAGSKKNHNNSGTDGDAPEWVKGLMQTVKTLNSEIAALKGEKLTNSRRSKLEELLKDSGTFGTRILKNFSKMQFGSDEEFEEFYSEVEDDLESYNQELADKGLSSLRTPPSGGSGSKKEEPFSDAEIDAIAD